MAPPIPLLFGPMLIGVLLNTVLYGILVMQMFIYMQTYKNDALWIRLFMVFLFVAETVNSVLNIHMIYEPLILKYGTPDAVTFFPLMLAADPIMTVMISTPVQIFIAWRIRIISKATWVAAIICALAVTALGGGLWLAVTVTQIRRFARKPELHWPALTWLLSSAIVDVLITVSLTYHLSRRKTGFSGTDTAINKIIRLTIQTGMVTALFASLDVICFLVIPHTTINFIWDFALSKLYTNALLSTLNARAGWGKHANGHTVNNPLFGSENTASRVTEATLTSFNFRAAPGLSMNHNASPPSVYAYEMEPREKARADLEHGVGVSVTKEVMTRTDPVSHLDMAQ